MSCVDSIDILQLKRLMFEVYAAGFEAAIKQQPLADAYDKFWSWLTRNI